ncbi:MAG: hypothetical protein DWQ48_13340 [Bacteroidetes bacterium]|nr:MAG: hypothetical protein DWQ48_13340 [Bacteroidota bacterium]
MKSNTKVKQNLSAYEAHRKGRTYMQSKNIGIFDSEPSQPSHELREDGGHELREDSSNELRN